MPTQLPPLAAPSQLARAQAVVRQHPSPVPEVQRCGCCDLRSCRVKARLESYRQFEQKKAAVRDSSTGRSRGCLEKRRQSCPAMDGFQRPQSTGGALGVEPVGATAAAFFLGQSSPASTPKLRRSLGPMEQYHSTAKRRSPSASGYSSSGAVAGRSRSRDRRGSLDTMLRQHRPSGKVSIWLEQQQRNGATIKARGSSSPSGGWVDKYTTALGAAEAVLQPLRAATSGG